jgi:tetratricopeptide (TPR) repeat protein
LLTKSIFRKALFVLLALINSSQIDAEVHPLSATALTQFENAEYDLALSNYNELIQQFPDKKEGYFNRGLCLYKLEKYSEAIADFSDCLMKDSTLEAVRFLTGMSLLKKGSVTEGIAELEKIPQDDPTISYAQKRIKNYRLAVYIGTRWYYMIAMALVLILLMALVANVAAAKKR